MRLWSFILLLLPIFSPFCDSSTRFIIYAHAFSLCRYLLLLSAQHTSISPPFLSTSSLLPPLLPYILSFCPICPWSHAALLMGSCVILAAIGYCLLYETWVHPLEWEPRHVGGALRQPNAWSIKPVTNDRRQQRAKHRGSNFSFRMKWDSEGWTKGY